MKKYNIANFVTTRACGSKSRKPDRYTKSDVHEFAKANKIKIGKKTMDELCSELIYLKNYGHKVKVSKAKKKVTFDEIPKDIVKDKIAMLEEYKKELKKIDKAIKKWPTVQVSDTYVLAPTIQKRNWLTKDDQLFLDQVKEKLQIEDEDELIAEFANIEPYLLKQIKNVVR